MKIFLNRDRTTNPPVGPRRHHKESVWLSLNNQNLTLPRFNPGVTEGPVEFGTVAARSFFAVSMMLWLLFGKTWLLEFVRFEALKRLCATTVTVEDVFLSR